MECGKLEPLAPLLQHSSTPIQHSNASLSAAEYRSIMPAVMVNWKKNLVFVWLSQFLSIMGFSFALPFVPYYMQELGVTDPLKLKLWIALFAAAAPVSLAIFAPVWGTIADRFGRRLMLLRANLGSAFFLCMMGMVESVPMLIMMRCLQGVLTGTMTAAQTLVASHTPDHRSGFALGALSSGVYSGAMAGTACGGFFADLYGFRGAFFISSGLLVVSSLLILFGTREEFVRPNTADARNGIRARSTFSKVSAVLPVLILLGTASLLRRFDQAFLPLLVQDIHGTVEGAAGWMGSIFATAGLAGFLSALTLGHLSDRLAPAVLGCIATAMGGLLTAPHAFANSLAAVFFLRFGVTFCVGGLEPVFQSWVAKSTPREDRGLLFGSMATVRAMGWAAAPLLSGAVAAGFGVRAVFLAGGCLFLATSFAVPALFRRISASKAA